MIDSTISGLFPAYGPYYNIDAVLIKNLDAATFNNHIPDLEGLRSGLLKTLPPTDGWRGVIVFPSFHASAATIFILCSWAFKYLKCFFLVLNILMIIATPYHGTHYLVDVIAGIFIALILFAITKLPFFQEKQTP